MAVAERHIVRDWDFRGENTRALTHCFHDYPARMIPQIAAKLLETFGMQATRLLDPYCGTGTSLVEAQLHSIDAVGLDLNPLARLIAKVKTTPIRPQILSLYLKDFTDFSFRTRFGSGDGVFPVPNFSNVEFWFQPDTIRELARIKRYIWHIEDTDVRDFFKVAFSETVRECSLTRNGEFKLFRMQEARRATFAPDVYGTMESKLCRNQKGMLAYLEALNTRKKAARVSIFDFNTVEELPFPLSHERFDIVITSPPYGDSRTTVAYGQYSRLSSQWLDLADAHLVDKRLMGGRVGDGVETFGCDSLDAAIDKVTCQDEKRAKEIVSFYTDLEKSISHIATLLKHGGYACYVVGNRRVKGVTLPTDEAISAFFEKNNFVYVDTFHRNIPNKRMPAKNSPTNIPGKLDETMSREYIVIMRKS